MEGLTELTEINELIELLEQENAQLPLHYSELNAGQWARILEGLTNDVRLKLWPHIDASLNGAVLAELHEDTLQQFLAVLPQKSIEKTVCASTQAEAVEILEALPQKTARRIVKKLSPEAQSQVEVSFSYNEDQVGRYANQQVYTIDKKENVAEVIAEIKSGENTLESSTFIVVNKEMHFIGEISINELLNAQNKEKIAELVNPSDTTLNDLQPLLDASNLVKESQRNYLPVINEDGRFIGIFSIQDALDVFQDFYEAQVAHMGNVSDEDLFSPVLLSSKRRAVWLGINLITAFLASTVIGVFDEVLLEVVALAVLMPIVASMGGITGSQSLTLTIRGLATGQISKGNLSVLRNKEFMVAFINSLFWALLVAFVCHYWFENTTLAAILAISIVINMLVASLSGVYIPVVLEKLGVDPAIAGSVILTTVTDVVGFFVFLGGSTLIFLN